MLLLPPKELAPLLCLLLTLLTIHATINLPSVEAPVKPIITALDEDHDVTPDLASAVLRLFGDVEEEVWRPDTQRMVGEVGRGFLMGLKSAGTAINVFTSEWKEQVGETWEELVDVKLLEVGLTFGR